MPARLSDLQVNRIISRLKEGDPPKLISETENVHIATVYRFKRNTQAFATPYPDSMLHLGRPKKMTREIEEALLEYLLGRPDAMLEEQQYWLWDNFGITIHTSTISRFLKQAGWTNKKLKKRASEQCPFLREAWMRRLASWTADQLVYVDESAANEHTKDRKCGWAPKGIDPVVYRPAKRSERYSILPAYTLNGLIAHQIIQGAWSSALFNWFIEEFVLPQCIRYPGPRSVLILDNASIHKTKVSHK